MSDAGGYTVRVTGARELRRALRQAAGDLTDLKEANNRAANIVAGAARARGPVLTGRLIAGIRAGRAAARAVVTFGGARVKYAGVVHYGWPARGIAPNEFVIEAAQATESQWLGAYTAELGRVLDKAARSTPTT